MKAANLMILAGALALPGLASAADFYNGKHTLLCTIQEIHGCSIADECVEYTLDELDAPKYFLVDFENERLVTTEASAVARESAIGGYETLGDKLYLQGRSAASETNATSSAWTLGIADPEGTMAFSVVRDDMVLSAFGACVPTD